MAHVLDPKRLSSNREYCAALDERQALCETDDDAPSGWRFDELTLLIQEYESTMRSPGVSWPVKSA